MAKLRASTQNNNNIIDASRKIAGINLSKDISAESLTAVINTGDAGFGDKIISKSFGSNGYIRYGSGLILQWGRVSPTGSKQTVYFPTSFSNDGSFTLAFGHVGVPNQNNEQIGFRLQSNAKSGFFETNFIYGGNGLWPNNQSLICCYIAIGY